MKICVFFIFFLISFSLSAETVKNTAEAASNTAVVKKDTSLVKTADLKSTRLQVYVDSLAGSYLQNPANSGLSIGIIKDGQTFSYFYGETKKGTSHLPNASSLYEIASISKTFTALLLAHAVNQKKIKLADDIRKYLPGNYPDLQYKGQPISVVSLSNHTSGLPAFPVSQEKTAEYDPSNPFVNYSKTRLYQYLSAFKPDTLPGTKAVYSNPGFAILGNILENACQLPLETLLQQVITGPLKMNSTFFSVPALQMDRFTTGYSGETGQEVSHWEFGEFKAAGGLKSDLKDMLLYLKANLNTINADYLLTQQTTNQQDGFTRGLAWIAEPLNGQLLISHHGGTAGFRSYCGFIKTQKTGVVILSNSSSEIEEMATGILSFLIKNDTLNK